MSENPLASIIINNYNYGRFLTSAIESALHQTYPDVEIIVVDDGSTDNSREIITSYGDRIIPLLKENGGQASTLNAGFRISKGQIILFLDADDVLLSTTVKEVVNIFQTHPEISKVQYLLAVIDESDHFIGKVLPPRRLSNGDLRWQVLNYYSYGWPPTSGNAFPTTILHRLFPIPEEDYRISADMYLADLSVLLGPVISLNSIGGYYRAHGTNYYSPIYKTFEGREDLDRLRGFIRRIEIGHTHQQQLAQALGMIEKPIKLFQTWDLLSSKMTSLKLDPAHHPAKEDTLIHLTLNGIFSAIKEPGYYLYQRMLHIIWFIGMFLAPRNFAISIAEKLYHPERRGKIGQFLTRLGRQEFHNL